jgi:hypothetical protein
MLGFFNYRNINVGIISTVLTSFSITYSLPVQALPFEIGFNEVAFMYRMEKLVEKMWKLEKSADKDKMYEVALDIKREVEAASGRPIDLNQCLNQVENEVKKKGYKPPKKEFDSIRKAINKKDKKNTVRAHYLARTMDLEGYQFNDIDEHMFAQEILLRSKHGHEDKDKEKDEKQEIQVPAHLVFGVTLTLCGVFLMFLPIPGCKVWGDNMFRAGIVVCGNAICNKTEEDKKNERDKK